MIRKLIFLLTILSILSGCAKRSVPIMISAKDYHTAQDRLTSIQVHDIFSPPVASRIYSYCNIAAYEAMIDDKGTYKTLANQLKGLTPIPAPKDTTGLNRRLASVVAFYDMAKQLIFSEDRIILFRDSLYNNWEQQNPESFKVSKEYGLQVAKHIKAWMKEDNYAQTRTMPKFSVFTDDETRWQPTPPAYMDGIEPHWAKIRPFVIQSSDQFKPVPPPKYSMEENSQFHKELMEVYETNNDPNGTDENSEETAIAQFWDCNPYVSTHKGHLMFATKKITPGAHWIGITKIACKKTDSDYEKTVYAYTKTSIAMSDAFISCWDEKYRSNLIRPETVINKYIDENWVPVLQTPPFPEYTSGHSVVSGAAAVALTSIFGDDFSFKDDTEIPYGLPIRSFTSFNAASSEAAISRLYGGIHYRAAVEIGLKQGRDLGHYVIENLQLTEQNSIVTN